MLKALMDRVDSKQEHMGNVSKEMEILRDKKKCYRSMPLMRLLVEWTCMRKKNLSVWGYLNSNLQNEKQRERTLRRMKKNSQKLWGKYKGHKIYVVGIPKDKNKETEELF